MEEKEFDEAIVQWAMRVNARKFYNESIDELINKPNCNCQLFRLIDKYILSEQGRMFQKTLDAGSTLYRARAVDGNSLIKENGFDVTRVNDSIETSGFNEENSVECPLMLNHQAGRNNIPGMSFLYVTGNIETACAEIKTKPRSFISVAEFELKAPMRYIDFSSDVSFEHELSDKYKVDMNLLFTLLMQRFFNPVDNDKDYYATQLIADHIRKAGYDGIAYRSLYTNGIELLNGFVGSTL